jgi:hypothetical protein
VQGGKRALALCLLGLCRHHADSAWLEPIAR